MSAGDPSTSGSPDPHQPGQVYAGASGGSGVGRAAGSGGGVAYSSVPNPTQRPNRRRFTVYGIMITGFLLSAGVLSLEFRSALGLQTTLLVACFAAIPLPFVVPTSLWVDRY